MNWEFHFTKRLGTWYDASRWKSSRQASKEKISTNVVEGILLVGRAPCFFSFSQIGCFVS